MTALTLERIKTLSDKQLLALSRSLHTPPKPDDMLAAVQAELAERRQRAREAEQLPITLQAMASRLTGSEPVEQLSQAEALALIVFKPDCLAALRIEAQARGTPMPPPGNVPRRRYMPPQSSPPRRVPAQAATPQPETVPAKPAPTPRPKPAPMPGSTVYGIPTAGNVIPLRAWPKSWSHGHEL